jgi:hypothetical protein
MLNFAHGYAFQSGMQRQGEQQSCQEINQMKSQAHGIGAEP